MTRITYNQQDRHGRNILTAMSATTTPQRQETHTRIVVALSCASGAAFVLSFSILMIGIFMGPIWLIALAVFIGCCSVICVAYILTTRKKFNSVQTSSSRGESRGGYNTVCTKFQLKIFRIY